MKRVRSVPRMPMVGSGRPVARRGTTEIGVTEKLQYRFDNLLARGTWVIVLWLVVATLALAALAALVFTLFHLHTPTGRSTSFAESFWQSLLRIIDTGTMAGDEAWPLRFVALFVTLSGLFLASALIGLIVSGIDRRLALLRRGRSTVIENGHLLVLGWSPLVLTIIAELVLGEGERGGGCVVVLCTRDKEEMEDQVRASVPDPGATRIVCRTGDPSSPVDLAIVRPTAARSIVILSDDTTHDAAVVKTVLAVLNAAEEGTSPPPIIAEVSSAATADYLEVACGPIIHPVRSDEVVAGVMAQTCRQPGLSTVLYDLMDFRGDELHLARVPELVGRTFSDALTSFEAASVIGRWRADGSVDLLPPMTTTFEEGDGVVAIAETDRAIVFSGFAEAPTVELNSSRRRPEPPRRVLVIGWNRLGQLMMNTFGRSLPEGSVVQIVYDPDLAEPSLCNCTPMDHASVEFTALAHGPHDLAAVIEVAAPDRVFVLGYRERLASGDADAHTLLSLLVVDRALAGLTNRPMVVAELMHLRDLELAGMTHADDFIVTDVLSGLLMAQLAEHPELDLVFDDLLGTGGASIELHQIGWYGEFAAHTYLELVRRVAQEGDVAIGFRRPASDSSEGTVTLNPAKSLPVDLRVDDEVIVISRSGAVPSFDVDAIIASR